MRMGKNRFLKKQNILGILISGFAGWYVLSLLIYKSPTAMFMDLKNAFKRG
jgi:hypothetical protein